MRNMAIKMNGHDNKVYNFVSGKLSKQRLSEWSNFHDIVKAKVENACGTNVDGQLRSSFFALQED